MKTQKLKTKTKFAFLILILLLTTASLAQAAPTFQAAGTAVGATGSVSPAWPAHQINDIALLFVESRSEDAVTLSTPAGFVEVTGSPQATVATGNNGTRLTVFWARATSAAMAAPQIANPPDHVAAQILTYRGVIANGNPWNVTGGGVDDVFNTSVIATGVTTTVADTLIVVAVAQGRDATLTTTFANPGSPGEWSNVNLTNIAERADYATNKGKGGGFGVMDGGRASTGATGSTTVTMSNPFRKAFLTIALQPPLMSTIYAINNNAAAIQRINPANSVATTVYSSGIFPLANRAAGLAQCPDGMLYFIGQTGTLYSFNPNTSAVAPVNIGNTGLDMIRMTCHPTTGVLYGMTNAVTNLYTINKATAATTAIPLTVPVLTPPAAGSEGDIAFDADVTLYFVGEVTAGNAATERLWIINLVTNTFENVGAVTGLPAVANGIAFDNNGNVLLSLTGQQLLYTVSVDGGAATAIGVGTPMPAAVYDLSSVNVLQLTKTNSSLIGPGATFTYTVVLTAGAVVNNAVFTDPAVTNLDVTNVTCAGARCPAPALVTVAAMQGAGITIPLMSAGDSVTFTITANASVAGNPTGTLTNTATVTLSGQTNSPSNPVSIKKARTTRWREATN